MSLLDLFRPIGSSASVVRAPDGSSQAAVVLSQTYGAPNTERIAPVFREFAERGYAENSVVFGAILARLSLFSETEFKWQRRRDGKIWGNDALRLLEEPWPNGSTGELLARMIQDVDLAGNSFTAREGDRLVRLRPDWVVIAAVETEGAGREVVGYAYDVNGDGSRWVGYPVDEVAHWSPIPDPLSTWRGMSWLTPVVREITADKAFTESKIKFLERGSTPNLMLRYPADVSDASLDRIKAQFESKFSGLDNAWQTVVLDKGADLTVVGNTFQQMDFANLQAAGESRILIASGVPGVILGAREGLQAATYSNYEQAMRRFADLTMRPLWRSACAALEKLVEPPGGARLWFDVNGIAALRQGENDRATTVQVKALTAGELIRAGYEPDSVARAVEAGDLTMLKHSGKTPTALYDKEGKTGGEAEDSPAVEAAEKEPARALSLRHPGHPDQKSHGRNSGAGTKDAPIRTGNVEVAQRALAEGKYVELSSTRKVSTLLNKLKADVDDARKKGNESKKYDLCKVTVPGTNLFCSESKGIPRVEMPQLKVRADMLPDDSPAKRLPQNAKGEVDLAPALRQRLAEKGITTTDERVDAGVLKATQNQLEGAKVVGIADAMRKGKVAEESILVTDDDYILDGHHRWAANVANEFIEGKAVTMPVTVIHTDIITAYSEAMALTKEWGVPGAGIGVPGRSAFAEAEESIRAAFAADLAQAFADWLHRAHD